VTSAEPANIPFVERKKKRPDWLVDGQRKSEPGGKGSNRREFSFRYVEEGTCLTFLKKKTPIRRKDLVKERTGKEAAKVIVRERSY